MFSDVLTIFFPASLEYVTREHRVVVSTVELRTPQVI